MKDIPILFSAPMVRAILANRKTVTRRISKQWLRVKAGQPLWVRETFTLQCDCDGDTPPFHDGRPVKILPGVDGDDGWLQPHYRATDPNPELTCERPNCDNDDPHCHWQPSIHMPRWASRITLEATEDARVERLWDITECEAIAEGINTSREFPEWRDTNQSFGVHVGRFAFLWSTLHGDVGTRWEDNPEVVRIAFRRICGQNGSRLRALVHCA